MADNNNKRKSQETHDQREGHPRALAPVQPQPMPYRLAEQPQHPQMMPMQSAHAGLPHAQSSAPSLYDFKPLEVWQIGYNKGASDHQQEETKRSKEREQKYQEEKEKLRAAPALLHTQLYKARDGASKMKAKIASQDAEIMRLRQEVDILKNNPAGAHHASPNDSDKLEISRLQAEIVMLRDHMLSNNGTLHGGTQAATFPDTASSPQAPTPTSSSTDMPANPGFTDDGTFQGSCEAGQVDPAIAAAVANAVAGASATNYDPAATYPHGGLHTSLPLIGEATWNDNSAWPVVPGQMQQNIDSAAFYLHGGLHSSLPTTNASWAGNSAYTGGPGQMQQHIGSVPVQSYGGLQTSYQFTGIVSGNSANTWNNAPGGLHQNMMLQPSYTIAPATSTPGVATAIGLTQSEMYIPVQPAVDTIGMQTTIAGAAPNAWEELIHWDGEEAGHGVAAGDTAVMP